jgi:hypothetical protein
MPNLPDGAETQISPSIPSTGVTSITPGDNPNDYDMSSFFDVYTEISLGEGWSPCSTPATVQLHISAPESSTWAMLVPGLAGLGVQARRSRAARRQIQARG